MHHEKVLHTERGSRNVQHALHDNNEIYKHGIIRGSEEGTGENRSV